MNKIWLIIQREYITRVRKRIFIVTTLLAPVGIVLVGVSTYMLKRVSVEEQRIGVIDQSADRLFAGKLTDEGSIHFRDLNDTYDNAKKHYRDAHLTGILYVKPDFNMYDGTGVEYYSDQQLGLQAQSAITAQMSKITRGVKLAKVDITPELIDQLSKDVDIKAIVRSPTGEKVSDTGIATVIGGAMGLIIYMVMIIYGAMVMRGVMEEKTNRIAEVMVSSVKPFQLMMGKIVGIGMVGLTQFTLWIILSLLANVALGMAFGHEIVTASQPGMAAAMSHQAATNDPTRMGKIISALGQLQWGYLIGTFMFFFFGGYMLYAALFAAVGSAAGEEGDQSLSFIVTLPVIISFIVMMNTIEQPNGTVAVVASLIPFSAPIVMCARLPFDPPAWQVAASMLSLIAGFILTTWLAAKIYRTGILMYGKKVTVKELGKWLTYKN